MTDPHKDVTLAEAVQALIARLRAAERGGRTEVTVGVPELRAVVAEAVDHLRADQNRLE